MGKPRLKDLTIDWPRNPQMHDIIEGRTSESVKVDEALRFRVIAMGWETARPQDTLSVTLRHVGTRKLKPPKRR